MESTRSERSRRKQTKIADSEWRVRVFHWWNEWMKRWRMAGFCQRADRLRRYLLAMTWLYYQERFLRPAAEDDAFAMDSSFGRPGTWQPLRINKFQPAAPCRNPSRLIFLLPPFLFSSFSRPSFSLSFPAFDPGEPAGILFISQQLCRHITWECTRSDFIYIPQCSVCQQRPKCIKKIWDGRRRSGGLNEATGRKWKRSMARLSWGEWKRDEEKTWCVRERERDGGRKRVARRSGSINWRTGKHRSDETAKLKFQPFQEFTSSSLCIPTDCGWIWSSAAVPPTITAAEQKIFTSTFPFSVGLSFFSFVRKKERSVQESFQKRRTSDGSVQHKREWRRNLEIYIWRPSSARV